MNKDRLEELGERLHGIGHRRRELVEMTASEIDSGDVSDATKLFEELRDISNQAISVITQQREMFEAEISKLRSDNRTQ